jgi:hypothetical protein
METNWQNGQSTLKNKLKEREQKGPKRPCQKIKPFPF